MFLAQSHYIGIDLNQSSLRFASLRKIGGKWRVSMFKELPGPEGISLLSSQVKDEILVSALNTRETLMRTCEIPLKKNKDISEALNFHIEPLLPYAVENGIFQTKVLNQNDQGTSLQVFAVKKDHLSQHLELLKQHNIEPEATVTKPQALTALATLLPQNETSFFLVHEGDEEITVALIEKGTLLAIRSIDTKKDLTAEIQKTFLNFSAAHKGKAGETIYFFSQNDLLKKSLQEVSGKSILKPPTPFANLSQEEFLRFGMAIGIALSHSLSAKERVNFRQKEFAYPRRFKRVIKPLALFFVCNVLLTAAVFSFGELDLARKKEALDTSYSRFLKSENVAQGKALPQTSWEYDLSLNALEKNIRDKPETFPLLPQVPKVKEVLSWLSSISSSTGKEKAAISIESFAYQMTKYPDFSHTQEKYKVRIDLEVTAKDPQAARSFHEALKATNSLADTKEEIQWLPIKGKYKASFFLKDKTKYN